VSGERALTAASSSKPSAPGMRMSVTTTSYGRVAASESARAPSSAVSTWKPSARMRASSFRMFSLSSTTRMRAVIGEESSGGSPGPLEPLLGRPAHRAVAAASPAATRSRSSAPMSETSA
jgi:hypothetical protein